MTVLDWTIVLVLNAVIIGVGFVLARGTRSSSEWFLGRRALPWWVVGLSMFATNVDSADLVAVTGSTYKDGIHIITVFALGSALGGILAAFFVVPAIYRLGFYTNSEYLEARFGPTTRVLSALIQIQYRSIMVGLIVWAIYKLLTRLVQVDGWVAWTLIVGCVVASGFYTALGGLKSVVWTDALQGLILMAGSAVIVTAVWQAVGGWSGMEAGLADADKSHLAHVSGYQGKDGTVSPWLVLAGWTIIGCGYWTVNHTQTMRLMGTRSLWDMKMAALFGVALSLPIMVACSFLGVFAQAIPAFRGKEADALYPLLANAYLGPGLTGLVVAGVVAAAISTFDSMGSALSAVFTRDIYARLIVRDGDDAHYTKVSRFATLGVLCLGFLYLPFIMKQKKMLDSLTTLISVFVTPLLTIYAVGVLTRAHRSSGLIGLAVGSLYGLLALVDREWLDLAWLPNEVTARWPAFSVSLLITATTMGVVTLLLGRDAPRRIDEFRESGWLARSRETLPPPREYPSDMRPSLWLNPTMWAWLLLAFCAWLELWALW